MVNNVIQFRSKPAKPLGMMYTIVMRGYEPCYFLSLPDCCQAIDQWEAEQVQFTHAPQDSLNVWFGHSEKGRQI